MNIAIVGTGYVGLVIHKVMRRPLVVDGRNILDSEELQELGFEYHCIGK